MEHLRRAEGFITASLHPEDGSMGKAANEVIFEPAKCFATPHALIVDDDLSEHQKLQALSNWEEDARRLSVAEEEGMTGGEKSRLDEVMEAQGELSVSSQRRKSAPTKTG
jgi:hypothetical protein